MVPEEVKLPTPVLTAVYNSIKGGDIRWKKLDGAVGYIVYAHRSDEGLRVVEIINDPNVLQCFDTKIKDRYGKVFSYYVVGIFNIKGKRVESRNSNWLSLQRLAPMEITTATNVSAGAVEVKWKCAEKENAAYGYEVHYAENFSDLDKRAGTWKSVMVDGRQNMKTTIKKLTKGKNYCFRVRSYVEHTSISSGQTLRTWSQFSPVVYVKVTK